MRAVGVAGAMAMIGSDGFADAGIQPASIEGPVGRGLHSWPFAGYLGNLSDRGYVQEEYLLGGEARRYRPVGEQGTDGRWEIEAAGTAPFKTRMMIQRPLRGRDFNGTVILEWINVTAGFDTLACDLPGLLDAGFGYAAVSAQSIGIDGYAPLPGLPAPVPGLRSWDGERYGTLLHPGDSFSYDIFSQAGRSLGPNRRPLPIDPLGGLPVERIIAIGASQSATRLTTYANAVQSIAKIFDAIVLATSWGVGRGFDDAVVDLRARTRMSPAEVQNSRGRPARIRSDLGTPVMIVNSETESPFYRPVRQADTDRFRFWEVAGSAHAYKAMLKPLAEKIMRDLGSLDALSGAASPASISEVAWAPVVDAAVRHVDRWVRTGAPPPRQEPIRYVEPGGKILRDGDGIAVGGVRLPDVAVPIARNDGADNGYFGHCEPFAAEKIRALYPTHERYVDLVTQAARAAEHAGIILAPVGDAYVRSAEAAAIP